MKKFIVGIVVVVSTLVIGCSSDTVEAVSEQHRYIQTEQGYDIGWTDLNTIVDTDTGVEYMIVEFGGSKGGVAVTPLYNADGTLKTAQGKAVTSYE